MPSDRLRGLEALLDRVRRRAVLARPSLAPPSLASDVELRQASAGPVAPEPFAPAPAIHFAQPAARQAAPQAPLVPMPPMRAPMESSVTLELLDGPLGETLGEEDLVEMSSDVLESVPPGEVTELSREEQSQEPPASSKRPRSLNVMEETFSRDADEDIVLEDGREVPLKTPPPESGPQQAPLPAGLATPDAPDLDALLEADLLPPVRGLTPFESVEPPFGSSAPASMSGPTTEQLGQTIDLEEARGPDLELDAFMGPGPRPTAPLPVLEELEVTLPRGQAIGGYDENLEPPPQALDELDAHRRKALDAPPKDLPAPVPRGEAAISAVTLENSGLTAATTGAPTGPALPVPEVFERTTLRGVTVQEIVPAASAPARPSTFAALLDASIALGG